ncbi:major capsid protein [Corynebacterium suicordis]
MSLPLGTGLDVDRKASRGTPTAKDLSGASVFLAPTPEMATSYLHMTLDNPKGLSDMIAARAADSIAPRIFGTTQKVNTAAMFHTRINPEDTEVQGIAQRSEGTEYQMVRITPPDIERIEASDIGGKFRITDEALENGVVDIMHDGIALIGARLADVLDEMALTALATATTQTGEYMQGHDWGATILDGATPTPPTERPTADLIEAQTRLRTGGMRSTGDLLVLSPLDEASLKISYGDRFADMLSGLGLTTVSSPLVPAGTAYVVDSLGLGGITSKHGLVTETWRDNALRSTWVQVYLEPSVFVTRPGNIVRIDNINTAA